MSLLIALLVAALIGLSAWLLWMLDRLQRRLASLEARLQPAARLSVGQPGGPSRIAIEILNPFELAAKENRMAPMAARLAPKMIERIVYERAAQMIAAQMADYGVRAEVKTHVA